MIQSANTYCDEVHFVRSGGVAVCEPTSYREPVVVYRAGTVFNLYQVLMDEYLDLSFVALSGTSFRVREEHGEEPGVLYDASLREYFTPVRSSK